MVSVQIMGKIFRAGKPVLSESEERVAAIRYSLDEALAKGVSFYASVYPGAYLTVIVQKNSKDIFGLIVKENHYKTTRHDICPLMPEVKKFAYNTGASIAQTYHDYPAFDSALIHSEVKGASTPCFHAHDVEAFKKFSGLNNIPAEAGQPAGCRLSDESKTFPKAESFPIIIPLYVYYQMVLERGHWLERFEFRCGPEV